MRRHPVGRHVGHFLAGRTVRDEQVDGLVRGGKKQLRGGVGGAGSGGEGVGRGLVGGGPAAGRRHQRWWYQRVSSVIPEERGVPGGLGRFR
jgi:hypothetical protein